MEKERYSDVLIRFRVVWIVLSQKNSNTGVSMFCAYTQAGDYFEKGLVVH